MIYLSQLILNPASRMAQKESRRPYELHRTLMHGFADKRKNGSVLHRLDINPYTGMMALLVQSTVEPNWQPLTEIGQGAYLLSPPAWKMVDPSFQNGQLFQFRLTANPSVKREGKRHALRKEEDQRRWLETKGTGSEGKKRPSNGFKIVEMDIHAGSNQHDDIHRDDNNKHRLTVYTVQFNGRLQITNTEKFKTALEKGIGPAKAFGCGLLSLAPT